AYFLALAETAERDFYGPAEAAWFARIETERANLRAALAWAEPRGDAEALLRLVRALGWFWVQRGDLAEGWPWTDGAAEPGRAWRAGPPALHARVLGIAADTALLRGDDARAEALCREGFAAGRATGDRFAEARGLSNFGWLARRRGDSAAGRAYAEEALPLW